ncbi:diguanylate cyclase [Marivibrio halodurans]|uniref:diguanylate cyclase n=1 Tax=Marivibrio halodurans TaxID=2039722 RepID=A0A8J7V1J4_9PROT|nr:sensor domain-containing diguanylate cyclase [Marivibrio halodurans]MBP5856166.1 diguanylate cyclase [Marivibrio halodurans]
MPPTLLTSTRSRLIAVVSLVLVLAFLGTNLISLEISRQIMRENLLETELPLTGDNIYSEIQIDLVRPIFVSSLMANDSFLHDWIREGELHPKPMIRYLDTIRKRYDTFTAFFVSEATRRYYHFSGVPQVVSPDDPEDIWYFRAREMDAPYEINIDPNQAQDNKITIFINYRVMDDQGHFLGVTGVGLELDAVARIVERYRQLFDRTVYFVNADGLVTVHPDQSQVYRQTLGEIDGLEAIASDILGKDRGAFQVERGDQTILMTTRYIPELDWWLVVEATESDVMGNYQAGFLSNLLIGLCAIVITLIAVSLAINRYQRRLEQMATTDSLTGLANRQLFDDHMTRAIGRARRSGRPISLIMLDIDRFKSINDRHGHLAGDRVLSRIAKLALSTVRRSDIAARWGGEEFVILMENCPKAEAARVAEKLRAAIETLPVAETLGKTDADTPFPDEVLTASFGVSSRIPSRSADIEDDAHVTEALLADADAALYRAKSEGRNRVGG